MVEIFIGFGIGFIGGSIISGGIIYYKQRKINSALRKLNAEQQKEINRLYEQMKKEEIYRQEYKRNIKMMNNKIKDLVNQLREETTRKSELMVRYTELNEHHSAEMERKQIEINNILIRQLELEIEINNRNNS